MKRSSALMVLVAGFILFFKFAVLVNAGRAWEVSNKCRRKPCDKLTFDAAVQEHCILSFNQSMATSNYQLNCPWPTTRRYYINLMICLENLATFTCCTDVSHRNHLLLEIHELYFSLCLYMKDPTVPILLLLTLPCVIIPFMIPFFWQRFNLYELKLPNADWTEGQI